MQRPILGDSIVEFLLRERVTALWQLAPEDRLEDLPAMSHYFIARLSNVPLPHVEGHVDGEEAAADEKEVEWVDQEDGVSMDGGDDGEEESERL
jgi:hypothetical protein